ncbi:MAG: SH3 domain-containing protein [Clostridia bacterium]|nr:SH3 domain-containing protein [Clostridia bacterium]
MRRIAAKRIALLLLCAFLLAPLALSERVSGEPEKAPAAEETFEERLLYGGTALDIGDSVFYSAPDGLRVRKAGEPEETGRLISPLPAEYLNHARGRIWFISGASVVSCLPDGSGAEVFREFTEPVSHLYVSDNNIYILRGETVCRVTASGEEALFTRVGIKGFIPENGGFRWVTENGGFARLDRSGDECYENDVGEYVNHYADASGNETDLPRGEEEQPADGGDGEDGENKYTGPYVTVGDTTLPLAQHMPGTFFSKDGKACTCHNSPPAYCIDSVGYCNCMRYYPTGYKDTCEVDLLGAQCFAFARMVFYTCFGFIDHSMNSSLYYNVGTISRGAATANTVKELLTKAAPGAHVRLSKGHSVSILTMDDDFIVIYHGNAGGDGVATQPCVVSTRRYTWEQFASAAAAGIEFVNMPYNYPDTSVVLTEKETGYYRIKEYLNLRAEPNVGSEILDVIPAGTIVNVPRTERFWGMTEYGGKTGWVFLEYTTYYSALEIEPSPNGAYTLDEATGYVVGRVWKQTVDSLCENFDKQSITVLSPEGKKLSGSERVFTGCTLSIVVNGAAIDSKTLVLAGDVNANGYVDVGDYAAVRRAALGTYTLSGARAAAADVSGNGKIGAEDYAMIKRFFLGTLNKL